MVEQEKVALTSKISSSGLTSRWSIEIAVLKRSGGLWLVGRLVLGALLLLARANPAVLHPRVSLIFAGVVGLLSWLDTRRRNEDLLLANLGTSQLVVYLLLFGPAFSLECIVAVVGRL